MGIPDILLGSWEVSIGLLFSLDFLGIMSLFGPRITARPDIHGKALSPDERKAAIRRVESDLSLFYSDRLKLNRQKTDRDLALRKLRTELRRIQVEIERAEIQAKKDEVELRTLEENIRLAKKRLVGI
ncbi:MAG: hypothetical protein IPJ67_02630 [Candidatus Moraniibacteriota bacterium]|nr:MAG: hypothetical protein IPJ67_02630 [Candidatus Moranbacteria bacterium]